MVLSGRTGRGSGRAKTLRGKCAEQFQGTARSRGGRHTGNRSEGRSVAVQTPKVTAKTWASFWVGQGAKAMF